MIPLRDVNPSRTRPIVNYTLIGINAVFFIYELMLGPHLEYFIQAYGFVPGRFFAALFGIPQLGIGPFLGECLTVLTSMFLHGGWLHFLGNMLYLYIFGDNVEDRMGHLRYLGFYLLTGWIAAMAQGVLSMHSLIPNIGASGAISGVLGAYLRFFPHARILALVPVFFFYELVEVPALIYLVFWFILQFFQGTFSLLAGAAGAGGVAWWAHIGGFVGGVLLAHRFARPVRRRVVIIDDDVWPF